MKETLIQTIQNNLLQAMHDREKEKVSTFRMLVATMEKKKVEKKLKVVTDLSESDVIDAIGKNIKQLDQEIESLVKAGRDTSKQQRERELLTTFLPKQLTMEEVEEQVNLIVNIVKQAGGNMGIAMSEASAKMKGKADMKLVSKLVREGMAK